jgi:hypothetical protein
MPLTESIWVLYMRSWFHRLWTVQEIFLARHTEFVCSLKTLDGDILSFFAILMKQGKFNQPAFASFHIDLEGDIQGFARLGMILAWKQPSASHAHLSMFFAFVQWCRTKRVKLPVDRIYGLLSLCARGSVFLGNYSRPFGIKRNPVLASL